MVTWLGSVLSRYSVPSSRTSRNSAVGFRLTKAKMQAFISSSLAMGQLKRLESVSKAHKPALSLRVVMTGLAPRTADTSRVHSLAPPTWPESTEITFFPMPSTHSTAGSSCLSLMKGAMVRTQIPIAPTKIKTSKSVQFLPTWARLMDFAPKSHCRVRAIASLSLLMLMTAIFDISVWILDYYR